MLGRGVCQECPLSCHLFNLVSQVLIYALQQRGLFAWWPFHGDPCSLYADDTAIFISTLEQIKPLTQQIIFIGHFTGLYLNLQKTIVLFPNFWNNWNKNKSPSDTLQNKNN